ncbi:MAG: hypothetical protein IJE46_04220 [Clostridia bacterium]|nr:hypothetical protein [Clostridia bacterium]
MKKIALVLLTLLIILTTSSCYDSTEVDDMIYVLAIGVDFAENGYYEYTFQSAVPLNISSGVETGFASSEESVTLQNIKVSAPNLYSAIDTTNQKVTKEINISHCKLIVFSKKLAQSNLENQLKAVVQNTNLRPLVYVAIADGLAQDYLNNISSPFELSPARYYESFFNKDYSPQSFVAQLYDFEKNKIVAVPLIEEDNKITTSIIKEYTQIGTLDNDETVALNILTGRFKSGYLTVDKSLPAIRLNHDKMPNITVDTGSKHPIIHFDLSFYGTPTSIINNKEEYDEVVKMYIENLCKNLLIKSSKEFKADITNIEKFVKIKFLTQKDFEKFNWDDKYQNAEFDVNVKYRTIR